MAGGIAQMVQQGVGAMFGAYASREEGIQNQQALDYKAAVARNNAIIAEQAATYTTQAGDERARVRMAEGGQRIAGAEASYSAGNLDIGKGSPNNVIRDIGAITGLDVMTIRNNAARQAWKYRNDATSFTSQAGVLDVAARNAYRAGMIGAESSLLVGQASVADKWAQMSMNSGNSANSGYYDGGGTNESAGTGSGDEGSYA